MSDPHPDPDFDLQLRRVEAEERKAEALERQAAAYESIAVQLPALIEALKTSRSYGGSGYKKKDAVGFYPFVPGSLDPFSKGDTFYVPATAYSCKNGRVTFYSPFTVEGNLAIKEINGQAVKYPGAVVGSLKADSDYFRKIFGDWKPTEDGQPKWFKDRIMILTISCAENKPQEGKPAPQNKYYPLIVNKKEADTTDPEALPFTPFPERSAPPPSN